MSHVAIQINGRSYKFACADSDAARLEQLVGYLKTILDRLAQEHGAIGDERLVLMAAVTLADELFDARRDLDELLGADPMPEPALAAAK